MSQLSKLQPKLLSENAFLRQQCIVGTLKYEQALRAAGYGEPLESPAAA